MANKLPRLKRITSESEMQTVIQAAKDDNDRMIFPTHVVMKGDEIAGAWCLNGIPFNAGWHKTGFIGAKESLILFNTVASIMNDRGASRYFISCNNNSPFIDHMVRFGFEPIWPTNLFYKRTD